MAYLFHFRSYHIFGTQFAVIIIGGKESIAYMQAGLSAHLADNHKLSILKGERLSCPCEMLLIR